MLCIMYISIIAHVFLLIDFSSINYANKLHHATHTST